MNFFLMQEFFAQHFLFFFKSFKSIF